MAKTVGNVLVGAGLVTAARLVKKYVDGVRDGSVEAWIAELRERVEAGAD
jgi:hypothetical protein